MKDVLIGIVAVFIGAVFCFWGYYAMRIVIPIWGAFAGFMLGAGAVSALDDHPFLSTALGWVLGIFIGLLFAVIAYLFYAVAVVLAFASIGFTFGAGLMTALNIDWDWIVIIVGVAVGIIFGIVATIAELPMVLLVVFSTIAGSLAMTAGMMLMFGAIDTADWSNDSVVSLIDDRWWWWVIAFALAIAGLVAQMKTIAQMRWSMRMAWDNSAWPGGPTPAAT